MLKDFSRYYHSGMKTECASIYPSSLIIILQILLEIYGLNRRNSLEKWLRKFLVNFIMETAKSFVCLITLQRTSTNTKIALVKPSLRGCRGGTCRSDGGGHQMEFPQISCFFRPLVCGKRTRRLKRPLK
jgi:hypothetical protein